MTLRHVCVWIVLPYCAALAVSAAETGTDEDQIRHLIDMYATCIDRADTNIADQIWSNAPEVSFIHPLGEEHGRAQIEQNVIRKLMGGAFSERKLSVHDVGIHVYGDAAWSEFNWDFAAKARKDGSPFHSAGRETQIYHKEGGQWRLVHVHYSGAAVSGNPPGS